MESTFHDWINGTMGVPGDYSYKALHLGTALAVAGLIALLSFVFSMKSVSDKAKRRIIVFISVFQLMFEIIWRLIFVYCRGYPVKHMWPVYPCNVGGIIIPIIAICNWRLGKSLFYLFGFFGGVLTFLVPDGIFTTSVVTFPMLKNVIQHFSILVIPSIEHAGNIFKLSVKEFPLMVIGTLLHLFYAKVINPIMGFKGIDSMYLECGLPFTMKGVPNWVITITSCYMLFFVIHYISDIKSSNEQFRALFAYIKNLFSKKKDFTTDQVSVKEADYESLL